MALITPDFTEIKDTVGPGVYRARITDAKIGKWEGKDGKPETVYVDWTAKTFGEAEEKNNGRTIFFKTNIAGRGAFMLQNLYKAAVGTELRGDFDTEQLYGKELEITLTERTANDGRVFTEPKAFRSLSNNR